MKPLRMLIMLSAVMLMPRTGAAQIEGWPFQTGGHSGGRVARISGNAGGESRSAITLAEPVTGNARVEAWFYTGNAPDFNPDNDILNGNIGVMTFLLSDSQDSGPGIDDHYNGQRAMASVSTGQSRSGWLTWETGTFDGSPRFCGGFRGDCGVPTILPPTLPGLPPSMGSRGVKGIVPPLDEWWGLRMELDWVEETGRYMTWDMYYKQDSHPDWIPLTLDQLFADQTSDFDGYLYSFDEIYIDNRPLGARGFEWTYFDDISVTSLDDPEADPFLHIGFEALEGYELGALLGQPGTRVPPASLNTRTRTDWQVWEGPPLQVVAPLGDCGPGDIDCDGDVDFADFSTLAGNFTGTLDPGTGAKARDNGDFDADGDVDFGDFSVLAGNFTGTITAQASDVPEREGDVHLKIDLTNNGAMRLQSNSASLAGYSIRSPDSKLNPDADGAAAPFLFYLLNMPHEVTAGTVGAATAMTGDLTLDITFAGSFDEAENVVFEYTRFGEVTPVAGVVHIIPEPATMMLITAVLVCCRRRRMF